MVSLGFGHRCYLCSGGLRRRWWILRYARWNVLRTHLRLFTRVLTDDTARLRKFGPLAFEEVCDEIPHIELRTRAHGNRGMR